MPDAGPLILRYFDCRGRAQALRDVLIDARVDFTDDRLAVDPSWYALKGDPAIAGPFGSLPLLCSGERLIAQALAIASYLARRLGQYDGRSAEDIARLEMLTSGAYLELTQPAAELYWSWGAPADEAGWPGWFAGHVKRLHSRLAGFDALSPEAGRFLGGDAPAVADFFLFEAITEWRLILGPSLLGALDQRPRLSALLETLRAHARDRGCLDPGRRPIPFTGNPREAEALVRLRAEADGLRLEA